MLQVRGELDFLEEALGAERGGQLGPQDLDGHPPAMLEVFGQIDRGHAPAADHALDPIAIAQRGAQAVECRSRHEQDRVRGSIGPPGYGWSSTGE